jgi:hypothetical protein
LTPEQGRSVTQSVPEACLTNWFPLTPPPGRVRYYRFEGLPQRVKIWVEACPILKVAEGRLVGAFADPAAFCTSGPFDEEITTAYDISFESFATGGKSASCSPGNGPSSGPTHSKGDCPALLNLGKHRHRLERRLLRLSVGGRAAIAQHCNEIAEIDGVAHCVFDRKLCRES